MNLGQLGMIVELSAGVIVSGLILYWFIKKHKEKETGVDIK